VSSSAAAPNNSTPITTGKLSNAISATSSGASRQMMFADQDPRNDDETGESRVRPLGLDETIRAVICTPDTPEDLAGRVQQAIGEYSAGTDELHVSHAIAPDPRTGLMLYTALIILRPARVDGA
jgi:hypothetical protein